ALDCGAERGGVALLGGYAAQFKQGGEVVGLDGENLLDQLLELLLIAGGLLALGFQSKSVEGAQVFGVELYGLLVVGDGLLRVALRGAEEAEQVVHLPIFRIELEGTVEALGGGLKVALAQCQDSPVGPGCGLSGSDLGGLLQAALGANVIAYLKGREADVEGRDKLRVLRRGRLRKPAAGMAAGQHQRSSHHGYRRGG